MGDGGLAPEARATVLVERRGHRPRVTRLTRSSVCGHRAGHSITQSVASASSSARAARRLAASCWSSISSCRLAVTSRASCPPHPGGVFHDRGWPGCASASGDARSSPGRARRFAYHRARPTGSGTRARRWRMRGWRCGPPCAWKSCSSRPRRSVRRRSIPGARLPHPADLARSPAPVPARGRRPQCARVPGARRADSARLAGRAPRQKPGSAWAGMSGPARQRPRARAPFSALVARFRWSSESPAPIARSRTAGEASPSRRAATTLLGVSFPPAPGRSAGAGYPGGATNAAHLPLSDHPAGRVLEPHRARAWPVATRCARLADRGR